MDAATLEALKKSIEHWKENVRAESLVRTSTATRDCALCSLFYNKGCLGCPVFKETGYTNCYYTPYYQAVEAKYAENIQDFKSAAQAELDFLKSLLPQEEKVDG